VLCNTDGLLARRRRQEATAALRDAQATAREAPRRSCPAHQYHLGLWFKYPKVLFNWAVSQVPPRPIVTPFNGDQHAAFRCWTPRYSR
jgi:hypothetical protein